MDHGYYRDRLSAYLDQELTAEEMQAVSEHLEQCAECRKQLARLGELDRLVTEHSGLDGDDYFEASALKIEQSLGTTTNTVTDITGTSRLRFRGLWWKVTSVAASAAILVFIGLHRDDIFSTNDVVLPSDTPAGSLKQPAPVSVDTAALLHDAEATEPLSTAADQAVSERPAEAEDSDTPVPVGDEVKREESIGLPLTEAVPEPDKGVTLERIDYMTESKSSVPPPAPAGRISPGSATTSLQTEADPQVEAERSREQTGLHESAKKGFDEAVTAETGSRDSIMANGMSDDHQPARDLSYWIQRRDSLLARTAAETPAGRVKQSLRSDGLTSLAPSPPPPTSPKSAVREEADLLEAWYWISRLSEDTSATSAARSGLERIAADSTSANRGLAAKYLRQLRNK